jgi:hypothetical protein
MNAVCSSGANDNYVRITLTDADNLESGKSRKRTRTLEKSGADPKWRDGQGETLTFHGIRLASITLLVRSAVSCTGRPACRVCQVFVSRTLVLYVSLCWPYVIAAVPKGGEFR